MSDEKPMGQVIQIDEARIREQSGAAPCRAICGGANRGAGGAKGGDQGECGPAKHAPDAEPGKRVTGAERIRKVFAVTHPRWEPYA